MNETDLKDTFKYILKICMRICLRVFYIFPINNKKIFFMSTMGKSYSCNPKYIYKRMVFDNRFKDFQIYWAFKNPSLWVHSLDKKTKTIKKSNILAYFYHLLTSKVIIYNCGGFSYAPIRKKQVLIETWHGSPFKGGALANEKKSSASKKGILLADKDIKLYLSQSKFQTDILIRMAHGYSGEILECGCPRDDVFFGDNAKRIEKLRNKFGIKEDDHVVIYAPTFKGTEDSAINLDKRYEIINPELVKKSLSNRFKGNWLFATRGHQYSGDLVLDGADLDWSDYPDMQELLLIADVLITDYSSSMWDFSLTGKPCLLYVPDLEEYKNNDRGFLIPFDIWPGLPCKNNNELAENIEQFDENIYKTHVHNFMEKAVSYEKGTASSQVLDWIANRLNK